VRGTERRRVKEIRRGAWPESSCVRTVLSSHPHISFFHLPVSSFRRRRKKANFRKLAQASVKHLNAKHGQLMRDLKARQATQQAVARRMSRAVGKFWKKIDQVHGTVIERGRWSAGRGWLDKV
jgi:hypothetical protein